MVSSPERKYAPLSRAPADGRLLGVTGLTRAGLIAVLPEYAGVHMGKWPHIFCARTACCEMFHTCLPACPISPVHGDTTSPQPRGCGTVGGALAGLPVIEAAI